MKTLGIDYGSKRIGLALSDESRRFAMPHSVVSRVEAIDQVVEVVKGSRVDTIVIGESKDYLGKENTIMVDAKTFAQEIQEKTGIVVQFEPEFMTSHQAERLQHELGGKVSARGKLTDVDASAAAIILQSFLDRQNKA